MKYTRIGRPIGIEYSDEAKAKIRKYYDKKFGEQRKRVRAQYQEFVRNYVLQNGLRGQTKTGLPRKFRPQDKGAHTIHQSYFKDCKTLDDYIHLFFMYELENIQELIFKTLRSMEKPYKLEDIKQLRLYLELFEFQQEGSL